MKSGYKATKDRDNHFNSLHEICRELRKIIFDDQISKGLVIITGATNSGKSNIACGVIHDYLKTRVVPGMRRRLHLVTCEDPIEKFFVNPEKSDSTDPIRCILTGVEYTPREVGLDVPGLEVALKDALRQTPEMFYAGETRDSEDWPKLIGFAATGHRVITTAHAGSLQEAVQNVLDAMEAKTPASRSAVASRIQAVVHLRPDNCAQKVPEGYKISDILVPSAWRGTPVAVNRMMEYGVSSIVPYRAREDAISALRCCLGRAWFVERLAKYRCPDGAEPRDIFRDLIHTAAAWDLEGRL